MPKPSPPTPDNYTPVPPTEIVRPGDLYLTKKGEWVAVPPTDVGFLADWATIIRKSLS